MAAPTLDDLRDVPEAAWLWDTARARIVWANPPGIRFFGGESLFDLLDRPFGPEEPGVRRIVAVARTLTRGHADEALLHFPSSGATAPVACRLTIHALPDGRAGLLVVARQAAAQEAGQTVDDIAEAFDVLPAAALLVTRDGTIRHVNAAALALLAPGQRTSLEEVLGDTALAEDLLNRTEAAGTLALIRPVAVKLGQRDIRITLTRLKQGGGGMSAFALVMLEDVTERRALERRLTTAETADPQARTEEEASPAAPAPQKLPESDAAVFEKLGKTLEDGIRQLPQRQAAPPAEAPAPAPAARRKLQRIPDQVRLPLENRADAVLVAKGGQLLFANPAAARLFGYETGEDVINDESLERQFGGLGQSLPPTGIACDGGREVRASAQMTVIPWLGGPARQFVLSLAEAEAPPPADLKLVPATAEKPSAEAGSEPAPEPAKPSAEVIQLPFRQAASEADQELRAILDTAADGIITLDQEARIHTFSAGAEAIFGHRIADVAGKPLLDLLAPESRKTVRDYLAALQGPGLASVFNDGREVTAQVASVSHELRTPLNAIMGFSEVMRLGRFGEIDNEKYRGYVQDIHASGAHLLSLIDDLLDLSKVEAGKLELNFTAVNLGEVAETTMKLLAEQATAARVVLRKSFPADLPNVVADLRSMRQVMLNLLSNAIKFTDPGGQVVISAQLLASGELKLKVKDSGIGMDEDQLKSALEPFGRVATEGRTVQGTGLGLPLTKALVEANRASFHLTSEPRRGTLAEITFPTTRVLAE